MKGLIKIYKVIRHYIFFSSGAGIGQYYSADQGFEPR